MSHRVPTIPRHSRRLRILITTFPGEGHLQPMLPLARAARRAGHELVVTTGPDLAPLVQRRGFPVWPAGPTMAEAFAPRTDLPPPPPDQSPFVTAATAVFTPAAERLAADVLPRARAWRPDLVSEALEPAGLVVAARTGARHVVHGIGPLPFPSHWEDVAALERLCERWGLPGPLGGLLGATFLDICPPALRLRDHATTQRVRPLRPAAGDEGAADGLVDALAALPHRETVHLTLGTIFNRVDGAFDAALAGLRELPVNVVVAVGADVDPASVGPQPPNVLVERYVPHAALLGHCAAVVSHGGAATVLAAYRHGLPQLILPRGADQFDNAAAAVRTGAALSLAPTEADPGAVAAHTARLLAEPGFRAAARAVRAGIEAMPPAEDVLADLVAEAATPEVTAAR